MTDLPSRNRIFSLTAAGLTWLIVSAVAPFLSADHGGDLFVVLDEDSSFFPTTAEVIAATPAQSGFGDDAALSLAQSFTVTSAFSLETLFLSYELDGGASGDQALTMSIFPVLDVNATTHVEPPDPNDFLLSETVIFPDVGNTDTIAGIHLGSPLALAPGGYLLHFGGTTSPGWEWNRTTSGSGGDVYAGGTAYEDGEDKGLDDMGVLIPADQRDFSLALSSVPLPEPVPPVSTNSVMSGDLLAAATWENGLAPVGAPPEPNFIHNIVNGHAVTADGSPTYTGAGVNITDGSLTYTASAVQLPLVTVGEGTTVTETTTGDFFLGDIGAPELGQMELNGQLTIAAEGGADAGLDMIMSGTGTATVNIETGGTLFLTDVSEFAGALQFNGSGDEVLHEGPTGGDMTLEMNSTGTNRLALALSGNSALTDEIIFNQPGEIDHAADGSTGNNNRLMSIVSLAVNADVMIDLTKTYARSGTPNERRLFASNGWNGGSNVTATGTPTDPTTGDATLNELEIGGTSQDSPTATHFETDSYSGTLTLNDFLNMEVRNHIPSAEVIVNQNARLEFGHRDVESLFTTRAGQVTVNNDGSLEVGYEADDLHAPYRLQLTTQQGRSGDLTLQASSKTIMQISGTSENHFDTIFAEGTVTLGGTLELLINPGVPSQTVSCDPDVDCVYAPTDGDTFETISIVANTLPTDLDGNGSVGSEDLVIWDDLFGQTLELGDNQDFDVTADADGDDDTDGADFLAWQRDVGASGTVTGSITGDFDSMVIIDPDGVLAGFSVTKAVTATAVTLTINAVPPVTAVPEPSAVLIAVITLALGTGVRGWGSPRTARK